MFKVRVWIKATGEAMKRTPVTVVLDAGAGEQTRVTNRAGVAEFDLPTGAGRVFVAGRPRYQGHLDELIDIGEERTIVAGISKAYKPEALIGKKVVVVANLKPTKLMGVESHGMLLATDGATALTLVGFDREPKTGAKVR